VGRRAAVYGGKGLRNPLGPAEFEMETKATTLARMKLKLQGIVCTPGRRLAIVDGRVYAVGDELMEGIKLAAVEPQYVVLSDGKTQAKFFLSSPTFRLGRP